jgi:hypothetical protein
VPPAVLASCVNDAGAAGLFLEQIILHQGLATYDSEQMRQHRPGAVAGLGLIAGRRPLDDSHRLAPGYLGKRLPKQDLRLPPYKGRGIVENRISEPVADNPVEASAVCAGLLQTTRPGYSSGQAVRHEPIVGSSTCVIVG